MATISRTRSFSMAMVTALILLTAGAAQAGAEDEVKATFSKFVAAQNAHDLKAVGEILWDSPEMFWITRGQVYLGRDAALKRFGEYYQGTWALEPKINEIKVIQITASVAQLFAPTVFRIAPAGQSAQPTLLFLNQIYVKEGSGWRLASLFPILAP
jgi:ketosteroid isomerase-like protein